MKVDCRGEYVHRKVNIRKIKKYSQKESSEEKCVTEHTKKGCRRKKKQGVAVE